MVETFWEPERLEWETAWGLRSEVAEESAGLERRPACPPPLGQGPWKDPVFGAQ